MKKLAQKRIIVVSLVVLITAFSVYPVYLLSWGVNASTRTLNTLPKDLEQWESREPDESYSESDINRNVELYKHYINVAKKNLCEFSIALSSVLTSYICFVILLLFISKPLRKGQTTQCHHHRGQDCTETPPTP